MESGTGIYTPGPCGDGGSPGGSQRKASAFCSAPFRTMHIRRTSNLVPCASLVLPEGSTQCARQRWGRGGCRAADPGDLSELPGAGEAWGPGSSMGT